MIFAFDLFIFEFHMECCFLFSLLIKPKIDWCIEVYSVCPFLVLQHVCSKHFCVNVLPDKIIEHGNVGPNKKIKKQIKPSKTICRFSLTIFKKKPDKKQNKNKSDKIK